MQSRHEIILENLHIAKIVASKFRDKYEDALSEAFLGLVRSVFEMNTTEKINIRLYLYVCVRNQIIKAWKKEISYREHIHERRYREDMVNVSVKDDKSMETLRRMEIRDEVKSLLNMLPFKQFQICKSIYLDYMEVPEVAEKLRMTEDDVQQYHLSALESLMQYGRQMTGHKDDIRDIERDAIVEKYQAGMSRQALASMYNKCEHQIKRYTRNVQQVPKKREVVVSGVGKTLSHTKLPAKERIKIRERVLNGEKTAELAKECGVSRRYINLIVRGRVPRNTL